MCTIVAIKGRHARFPLIVAANRDEFYARPATPPQIVHEAPRAVAGLDLHKGGSWMGANERGIFIAITNQRSYGRADPHLASRGEIVLDALAQTDVDGVDALVGSLDPREYNGFNVIYGDADRLRVGYSRTDQARVALEELGDGVWVLPNDRIGSPEFPKTERAHALVAPILDLPWDALWPALARVMADHEKHDSPVPPPPGSLFTPELLRELQAICIHTAVYGTRSSTILAIERGRVAHYLFADGPPCRTAYEDVTERLSR